MTKLSIIVPVYNVERYLPVCLDSIRNQTFRDIEIICVDDGSTDRSSNILEMYSKVEPRMRIISKENGGCLPRATPVFAVPRVTLFALLILTTSWTRRLQSV